MCDTSDNNQNYLYDVRQVGGIRQWLKLQLTKSGVKRQQRNLRRTALLFLATTTYMTPVEQVQSLGEVFEEIL